MRKLICFNNASFELAEALPVNGQNSTILLPDRTMSEANLALPEYSFGYYTVATITHPSLPDTHEIVFLIAPLEVNGEIRVAIERGKEQTSAVEWPIGSLVECRVTQGMLSTLGAGTVYSEDAEAISINGGDVSVGVDMRGDSVLIPGAWSVGGAPVSPARGYGEDTFMASSVEGVGYSNVVELGVAPDYNPAQTYYPGDYVKDTNSPFWTFSHQRNNLFPYQAVALGDAPWVRYAPENDGNIVAFSRLGPGDVWFYPTEIGFICEAYSATSVPSITVQEVDKFGSYVGDLVAATPLTGAAARKRIVLSDNITKGINGLYFVRSTAAAGGTCRGRFYWKGLFICTNTSGGFPSGPGLVDGRTLPT